MRAMRRLRKFFIRWRPRTILRGSVGSGSASATRGAGELEGKATIVQADFSRGPAILGGRRRGSSAMTVAAPGRRRGILFFIVTQQSSGDLVDEVDAGAGRAVYGFVAVRMVRRNHIRHLNLNIHAGRRTAKNQFAHVFTKSFLPTLLEELDTIRDFCEYLAAREAVVSENRVGEINGGEQDLLAYYLKSPPLSRQFVVPIKIKLSSSKRSNH